MNSFPSHSRIVSTGKPPLQLAHRLQSRHTMIEPTAGTETTYAHTTPRKVFRMGESDRMAGSIPIWESPRQEQQQVEQILTAATTSSGNQAESFEAALAYQSAQIEPASGGNGEELQEFGFGDLVDMVNPLQHIPVVGHLYREVTGDSIKSISQIIGGAVFGGPLGAAGGLVNAIVREETGKDITGNALALAQADEQIEWRKPRQQELAQLAPETRLNRATQAVESAAYRDLPPSLLGFADYQAAIPEKLAEPEIVSWQRRQRYND